MSKYTQKERRGIAAAFRAAKKLVATGREEYICHALGVSNLKHCELAAKEIQIRISPWCSLNGWVSEYINPYDQSSGVMRAYRLRWLDHLITEFSSKG